MTAVRTTCPYCGVGCGVLVTPDGKGGARIEGDPDHPANFGRLCSKGTALGETLRLAGRILTPRIGGQVATWDAALDLVADRFLAAIRDHGPDSVALYLSGQMLTEDYYVANKLIKGYIGTANVDTNSRLCMASSVAGHSRAFGTDTVPGTYEDLDQADLVVLVGSNLAWCHPVLFQRLMAAKAARGTRIVVVDPRRTTTCDIADLHLALAPGSDAALFNAALVALADRGAVDDAYIAQHLSGFEDALAAARASDGSMTGLAPDDLADFLDWYVTTERVVTIYSQGINQSESGTDKVNAILNCHLATGRIGRPGMGPFSVTGQPNAMGGREVGGLANMLACHLDIENPDHRAAVQGFWDSPTMPEKPGLKAVEMFQAVAQGRIRALWIIHTNPAASMPDADAVARAIEGCDFVVVSDVTQTDTTALADVIMPATAWGEKSGTVTNSDRTISRQRPFLPTPGHARDDWRMIADVAGRMGWGDAFGWDSPAQIFAEYAQLSRLAGDLGRDFDISGLAGADYDALPPTRWPVSARRQGGRFFGAGGFFTPDARARMLPIAPRLPVAVTGRRYPFRLNTGRVRDQWHTMTRTALAPRLNQHTAEPFLEIHPRDAADLGLAPACLARVISPRGQAILRIAITDRVQCGQVFAPMHWTGETAPTGRVDALVAAVTDPVSGQPESKASVVDIAPLNPAWYGFAVSVGPLTPDATYWARARHAGGWRGELAGMDAPEDWEGYARALFDLPDATCLSVEDRVRGTHRLAFMEGGRTLAALFAASEPMQLARGHLAAQVGRAGATLLAGRPGAGQTDPGPTVCACLNVGLNTITAAIAMQNLTTVEQIGAALQAGTSCGSCRPELATLLAARLEAAE
ncbi:assimilatory nitrate reductase (NADH) alpha subunit apoprotein [Roseovarius azorensis]|uniref:Assimilatory nitrate reductase (NADH) alpha subunit apoprotein n=1 Tax=Roseovarius azorensis TaxID=1287727 RepID=A0A1H7V1N1_9RHOB|nr:nitrate reductase [Roseovarius azorensis]SEM03122.1 assimilatory nitrate reductase (NADH) alpha subunit apoprotein [Roseovarius azorensis]